MYEVTCGTCTNQVLVEKFSPIHTSIQWTTDARTSCPEFVAAAEQGQDLDSFPGCTALRACIDEQVRGGKIPTNSFREEPVPGQIG